MRIAVLGSTGSIGVQTLEVAQDLGYDVIGISASRNISLLARQAELIRPCKVCIADCSLIDQAREALRAVSPMPEILAGVEGLSELASDSNVDMVVNAVVGSSGLIPTLSAIRAGKDVALANKETLVAAGELVMGEANRQGVTIRPVDSEHSAIWQSLLGHDRSGVRGLILTASGGPFRNRSDLEGVTPKEALAHPNWQMGPKISVDSATMMNKSLEVIEARWLFDIPPERIEILVHKESIVHSLVEYIDGTVIAQLGVADMRIPIQYALTHPLRHRSGAPRLDLSRVGRLSFERPDISRFPGATLGHLALDIGGTGPAALSAANEQAVAEFLKGSIGFMDIVRLAREALMECPQAPASSLESVLEADAWARDYVKRRCA